LELRGWERTTTRRPCRKKAAFIAARWRPFDAIRAVSAEFHRSLTRHVDAVSPDGAEAVQVVFSGALTGVHMTPLNA